MKTPHNQPNVRRILEFKLQFQLITIDSFKSRVLIQPTKKDSAFLMKEKFVMLGKTTRLFYRQQQPTNDSDRPPHY